MMLDSLRLRTIASLLISMLLPPSIAAAQEAATPRQPAPRNLSISEAMRRAESKSENVVVASARARRADAQVMGARSGYFPQLWGSASYERTIKSEFEGLFGGELGGMDPMDMMGVEELPFGRANIYRVGVSASQNLFTGGRLAGSLDLARAGRRQAELSVAEAQAQAVLDAAQAYYDTVLSKDLVAIAETTLSQADETLRLSRLGFEQGTQPEFDVLRSEVTRDNQRSIVVQRRSEYQLALIRLQQVLELPPGQSIRLTSTLEDPEQASVSADARAIVGLPAERETTRATVAAASEEVRARQAALTIARSQRWPALQLVSNLGFVDYPEDLVPDSDWRTNFTVGVNLSVPIFTGGDITSDVRAAEADVSAARAQLESTRELSAYDSAQTESRVAVATELFEANTRTVAQAERAYEIAQLRYSQGVSTHLELVDSRVLLERARVNRAQAARDLLVARVRRALLPRLPLSLAAGVSAVGGEALLQQPGALPPASMQPESTGAGAAPTAGPQTPF